MRQQCTLKILDHEFGTASALAFVPELAQEIKPNVVFILADNAGNGNLGPYCGGELRGAPTPRIDQLAKEGLRPSPPARSPRAALMKSRLI